MSKNIVIIGNGISGITAARHIRKKSDTPILIISEESPFFFSRTALMYVFMGHMRFQDLQPYETDFWKKNKLDLLHAKVAKVNPEENIVVLADDSKIEFSQLIIASGSKPNVFNWPGVQLHGVQGLYHKQDLENLEKQAPRIKAAVIIGGGLIGVELAEMLLSRNIKVHFVVRENLFWNNVLPKEDAAMVGEHLAKHHGLTMHYGDELEEIQSNDNSNVSSVKLKSQEIIDCQFVGLTIGVTPNIDFIRDCSIEIDRGILVDRFLKTSAPNIYAIGDCAQLRQPSENRRPIEQVWYTGRIMGETVAKTIAGVPTSYNPGNWYNSAKFFDLEYQTYGIVSSVLESDIEQFIWRDEKRERMVHFRFDKSSQVLKGVNVFGIRLRHTVLDHWLTQQKTIEEVITEFSSANFDPEFFKPFETHLIQSFNQTFGTTLILQPKKWWQKIIEI